MNIEQKLRKQAERLNALKKDLRPGPETSALLDELEQIYSDFAKLQKAE